MNIMSQLLRRSAYTVLWRTTTLYTKKEIGVSISSGLGTRVSTTLSPTLLGMVRPLTRSSRGFFSNRVEIAKLWWAAPVCRQARQGTNNFHLQEMLMLKEIGTTSRANTAT